MADDHKVFSGKDIALEARETRSPVIAAFLEHIKNRECEACGTNKWSFDQGNLLQFVNVDDVDQGMAVLCLFCNNCGNTRNFAWGRIRHFIRNEYKTNVSS